MRTALFTRFLQKRVNKARILAWISFIPVQSQSEKIILSAQERREGKSENSQGKGERAAFPKGNA